MKVPYLKKLIRAESSTYIAELREHINQCATESAICSGVDQLYGRMFPLFMLLRQLKAVELSSNPTRDLLLERVRESGNKLGFCQVMALPKLSPWMNAEVERARKDALFTSYLGELWSDALLCLNSLATCNYRGAFIALRCMLEDLYRHLYYRDHPEEFGALRVDPNAEDKFGISPAELRDYLTKASYLREFRSLNAGFGPKASGDESDIFSLNADLYSKCSGYVHGLKLGEMNSFWSNSNAARSGRKEVELIESVRSFVKVSSTFLVAAHVNEFRLFNDYDKSIVLSAFEDPERHQLRRLLNV